MPLEFTEQEKESMLAKAITPQQKANVQAFIDRPIVSGYLDYRFKKATDKYPDQVIVYYVTGTDNPRCKRHGLVHLGMRPMDAEEAKDAHCQYRYYSIIYRDWEGLIEDEVSIGTDPLFIDGLRAAAKKHPILVKRGYKQPAPVVKPIKQAPVKPQLTLFQS